MDDDILFIFGLPGAGKSFVADITHDTFGYTAYNGDDALPETMKEALFQKNEITDMMREEFTKNLILSISLLRKQHKKIAIHQTLIKEFMRIKLAIAFPNARFLLVETDTPLREKRYIHREYFNLGLPYLRKMSDLFEKPILTHMQLSNSLDGEDKIIERLKQLL